MQGLWLRDDEYNSEDNEEVQSVKDDNEKDELEVRLVYGFG